MVAIPTLAAFFALFGGLALQMREGSDPALGAGSPAARKHTVLVRRTVRRTVVTHVVPATGAGTAAAGSSSGSGSSAPPPGAGSSNAAPAASTPAPAPPPAPAPTVVTRQS
ncbi:MAG: hypothetical protein U0T02_01965 [Solirubrobacteraceae bacterium]